MAEFRKDPVTDRWVIIAAERSKRPKAFLPPQPVSHDHDCPFCPGNEEETPGEVLAYRPADSQRNESGWWVRVIPNKFPALHVHDPLRRSGEGMYDRISGAGAHEVVIESPHHDLSFADLPARQIEEILWAYRDRARALRKDARFRHMVVFKNHGSPAGATIDHPHSQIIALPVVPKRVQEELTGAKRYYDYKERCVFCDMIEQERRDKLRIVSENQGFLCFEPYASRFPYETWILPRCHEGHFDEIKETGISDLALILGQSLQRLKRALDDPPYNFILHTTPFGESTLPYYHWHIEIMPKLTQVAGFEWGTGFYINPTPPELAADTLRNVDLSAPPPPRLPPSTQTSRAFIDLPESALEGSGE